MSDFVANRFRLIGSIVILIIFLVMVIVGLTTHAPVLAEHQPQNWTALLHRIQSSGKHVRIWMRANNAGADGVISDLGDDYVCLVTEGNSYCFPFDAIGEIVTPPGTFGDTEPGL